jgi:hypothetical protein
VCSNACGIQVSPDFGRLCRAPPRKSPRCNKMPYCRVISMLDSNQACRASNSCM